MKRRDILPFLHSTQNSYKQVCDVLRQVDGVELFFGLYPIAVERQQQSLPVLWAGDLLFDINPQCQISCKEAIRAMLARWDISIEEVPFYVYKQFGLATMREAISLLRAEPLSHVECVRLDTVKYWAEIADTEGIETIEKRRLE